MKNKMKNKLIYTTAILTLMLSLPALAQTAPSPAASSPAAPKAVAKAAPAPAKSAGKLAPGEVGLGTVDKNNDGVVSKGEADALAAEQFTQFDADKNGKLNASEFKTEIFKMNKAQPPADVKKRIEKALDQRFAMLDANKDGSVAKAEFMEDSTKRHKIMDQDGDGIVTKSEIKSLRDKMVAEMKKRAVAQKPQADAAKAAVAAAKK